jgi:hypothetical protein
MIEDQSSQSGMKKVGIGMEGGCLVYQLLGTVIRKLKWLT